MGEVVYAGTKRTVEKDLEYTGEAVWLDVFDCKFVFRQHIQKSGFQRSGVLTSVHKTTLFLGSKEGVSNLKCSKQHDIRCDTGYLTFLFFQNR